MSSNVLEKGKCTVNHVVGILENQRRRKGRLDWRRYIRVADDRIGGGIETDNCRGKKECQRGR
ncbi:5-methylthioadenosine/S-adenosylhomocysteine nucleosidase [Sesbania bispinosa]|nr:5-methylthioadenosine/S-adenosylhomocysteine nucleosidase [Sesbania bispinosa]